MRSFQASGGSIYVPVRGPRGNVRGLAFLCIEPFTRENQRLKSQIIPLRSHAGRCFTTGEPRAVANVDESGDHYEEADAIANYRPSSTLEVALRQDGDIIGVLQLLREKGEPSFLETHVPKVATLAHDLAKRVFEATRDIDSAKLLGLAVEDFAVEGTVMVFDLSRSARLFEELASSHALLLLNEFFEEMCQLAFAAGGTVDTYMGDGALLRFNVPKALADHELAAIRTAIEMGDAFTRLRTERWLSYGPEFADMHLRVGIATGPLIRANLGHSQVQHLTVLGHPISVAAALCDSASRDRNVILASEETVAAIRGRVICHAPDAADLAKALSFTPAAHEIEGIRAG
ncbi:MAG TPA: adenylate/guanylate cyclase domain-containing protein [Allosphingosinicella sp.]|nr:adenylate/guanylate cyclase domain-containing protein [Allosphingosinicella sp.]